MKIRVGLGYDVHAVGGDRPLVLGGVRVDGPGLVGHSDADAIAHAVADALLGAAQLPDLGTLFPAGDDRHRDADSIALLRDVVARVSDAGWTVSNVDVVIVAEEPRLAPHRDAMNTTLSSAVGAPVSVKPKRGEGVGALGRGEGIAVTAVALLVSELPGDA
ncbi:MAG TPA: 2-C-methyl-D-erythritol 2,4-cyclodiphosphate synthase [Acidimicrobiia bacterium]|nr:2-C-methyl-D-erythritol 2,4-cyclodiphosphate synthase [Acidimicrobiia bacterium]